MGIDVVLLQKPPKIPFIQQSFASIKQQSFKDLFDGIQEFLEPEDDENELNEIEDDEDLIEMKVYKILFDILISCNIQSIQIIKEIAADRLSAKQLRFDKRYHLFLNLQHFYHRFMAKNNIDHKDKDRQIVIGPIDAIYTKYSAIYPFLESVQDLMLQTKRYIIKCLECCFHFGSYSLFNVDANDDDQTYDEYGLFPLSFVRNAENLSPEILESFSKDHNVFNNEIIDFSKVRMGNDRSLCCYDDTVHQKESSSDVEDLRNAKICYFTWPAIVATNKNNEYLYGNLPREYLTKIWVLLNDEMYHRLYPQ